MTNTTSSSSGRTVVVAWGTILTVCIFSILLHGPQHITSNEHREVFTLGCPDSEAWTCAHVSPSFRSFRPSCRPSTSVEWPVELVLSCLITILPTSTQYQNSGISTTDTQPSQPMAHKNKTHAPLEAEALVHPPFPSSEFKGRWFDGSNWLTVH